MRSIARISAAPKAAAPLKQRLSAWLFRCTRYFRSSQGCGPIEAHILMEARLNNEKISAAPKAAAPLKLAIRANDHRTCGISAAPKAAAPLKHPEGDVPGRGDRDF